MKISAILAGITAVVLWAAIPALVKTGNQSVDISFMLFLRFIISAVLMVSYLKGVALKARKINFWLWLSLIVILGANYYFQALAMTSVPVSWYVVIFSLNPILALLLLKIPLNRRMVLPFFMALVGTFLFLNEGIFSHKVQFKSFIFLAVGMLTWVLYTVLIVRFQKVYKDLEVTCLTQYASLIAVFFIWLGCKTPVHGLTNESSLAILVLGVTTPAAYLGFSYCIRRLPVFGVVSQYLEPVVGIIIGVSYFNERLSIPQILGSVIIIAGMASLPLRAPGE